MLLCNKRHDDSLCFSPSNCYVRSTRKGSRDSITSTRANLAQAQQQARTVPMEDLP